MRKDKTEARTILVEYLNRYRARSYAELAAWAREDRIDDTEVVAPSGTRYQIEVNFFWDSKKNGDVRVMGAIDGGVISAFFPLTDSFILSPEGKFIGE
jgi:hypothetical protein